MYKHLIIFIGTPKLRHVDGNKTLQKIAAGLVNWAKQHVSSQACCKLGTTRCHSDVIHEGVGGQ